MIGSDEIIVVDALSSLPLITNENNSSIGVGDPESVPRNFFTLGDLLGSGFRADRVTGRVLIASNGQGEAWELI